MTSSPSKEKSVFQPTHEDGVPVIHVEELCEKKAEVQSQNVQLIDVRRPEEFYGELGHVEGSRLITLGEELSHFLEESDRDQEIIFICRSGARSGHVTLISREMGFTKTANLAGGMLRWNALGFPVEKK